MKKIAFTSVVPVHHLDELEPYIDMHFVIATRLAKNDRYLGYYAKQSVNPARKPLILDNGVHEDGHPMEVKEYINYARVIKPTFLVAPDVIYNYERTLQLTSDLLEACGAEFKVMFVPQGNTDEKIIQCYTYMRENFNANCWAWAYRLDRLSILHTLAHTGILRSNDYHHFLGLKHFNDLGTVPPFIQSIDTVKPIKGAYFGRTLWEDLRGLGVWDLDWKVEDKELLFKNLALMHVTLSRPEALGGEHEVSFDGSTPSLF